MTPICEIWYDPFQGRIPGDPHYSMRLENGEEKGLVIRLESLENSVTIDFGNVQAVNILDEGTLLGGPPNVTIQNLNEHKKNHFSSTIYLVENGAYGAYIKACMTPELYKLFNLRQYNIVTMNYVLEIIAYDEPKIKVHS